MFSSDKKAAGKVKGKNKLKLAFGGKTKEEKKEIKKEEKLEKAAAKVTRCIPLAHALNVR